jgi:hypothetical protein
MKSTVGTKCTTYISYDSTQNGVKHENALSALALGYTIRKVQEKQVELKLNGAHQVQVCADDINLLAYNINTHRKEALTISIVDGGFQSHMWHFVILIAAPGSLNEYIKRIQNKCNKYNRKNQRLQI